MDILTRYLKIQISKALFNKQLEAKKKFNYRAFVSVGLLVSGIGLPLSGLMNHYMGLDPLTVSRHFWMSVHDVAGIFFTLFAVTHIILNRHSIKNYVSRFKSVIISKEALTAIAIVGFFVMLISLHAFHVR